MNLKPVIVGTALTAGVCVGCFYLLGNHRKPVAEPPRQKIRTPGVADIAREDFGTSEPVQIDPTDWKLRATRVRSFTAEQPQPLNLPVADRLPELESQARNGDLEAALQLYVELERCATFESRLIDLETNLANDATPTSGTAAEMRTSIYESQLRDLELAKKKLPRDIGRGSREPIRVAGNGCRKWKR